MHKLQEIHFPNTILEKRSSKNADLKLLQLPGQIIFHKIKNPTSLYFSSLDFISCSA